MSASNITIVTKSTSFTFSDNSTHTAKGSALNVLELDTNFLNIKQGLITLESNSATLASPALTGTPTAPNPGGSGTSQITTVDAVNTLVTPISNLTSSATQGNVALANSIANLTATKANLAGPQFTAAPQLATAANYNFSTWVGNPTYLASVTFVADKLENITATIKPSSTATNADLGTPTNAFRNIYVYGNILPRDDAQGSGGTSDLGGPSKRFRDLYLKGTTINLGDTQLRDDNGTFVMPENTAIGNVNNVIPRNIASTTVDSAVAAIA